MKRYCYLLAEELTNGLIQNRSWIISAALVAQADNPPVQNAKISYHWGLVFLSASAVIDFRWKEDYVIQRRELQFVDSKDISVRHPWKGKHRGKRMPKKTK